MLRHRKFYEPANSYQLPTSRVYSLENVLALAATSSNPIAELKKFGLVLLGQEEIKQVSLRMKAVSEVPREFVEDQMRMDLAHRIVENMDLSIIWGRLDPYDLATEVRCEMDVYLAPHEFKNPQPR